VFTSRKRSSKVGFAEKGRKGKLSHTRCRSPEEVGKKRQINTDLLHSQSKQECSMLLECTGGKGTIIKRRTQLKIGI